MRRPEQQLHRQVVQLLQVYQNRGFLAFAHCPNGGYRTPTEAGIFTGLGVMPGVADLLLWLPGGRSVQLELKAPLAKMRLSPAQIDWIRRMADMGVAVHVCRSVDEVEAVLRAVGVPPVGQLSPGIAVGAAGGALDAPGRHRGTLTSPRPHPSHHSALKSEIP
jgi:hypothetical protein